MLQKFVLIDDLRKNRCIDFIKSTKYGSCVTIREGSKRDLNDNARLHAILNDIANQVKWHGMDLSIEVWKRLCTAAFLREAGQHAQLIPALDGHGIEIIYEKTSEMSKKMIQDLTTWCEAFGSEKGVIWSDTRGDRYGMD